MSLSPGEGRGGGEPAGHVGHAPPGDQLVPGLLRDDRPQAVGLARHLALQAVSQQQVREGLSHAEILLCLHLTDLSWVWRYQVSRILFVLDFDVDSMWHNTQLFLIIWIILSFQGLHTYNWFVLKKNKFLWVKIYSIGVSNQETLKTKNHPLGLCFQAELYLL